MSDFPDTCYWRTRKAKYALEMYHFYHDILFDPKTWAIETIKVMRWF